MSREIVEKFKKLRSNFILLGLTGRTGSGCTSVAEILGSENIAKYQTLYKKLNDSPITNDIRKDRIIDNYIRHEDNWSRFTIITVSDIILSVGIMELSYDKFCGSFGITSISSIDEEKYNRIQEDISNYSEAQKKIENYEDYEDYEDNQDEVDLKSENEILANKDINKYYNLFFEEIPELRRNLNQDIEESKQTNRYTVLQEWGDNIRKANTVNIEKSDEDKKNNSPFYLADRINKIVKLVRKRNKIQRPKVNTNIVIDAIRNPFEVLYFRERYSSFYLISVNVPAEIRRNQLTFKGVDIERIREIDRGENQKTGKIESFNTINIDKCIELSDIFIAHNGGRLKNNRELVTQIFTYVSLIKHPGLISPSPVERLMQIAFTAKLNSGCLSRQVGAAVTDKYFSLKSIGWNTTAEGQTPCSLRSLNDLHEMEDKNAFSEFEKTNMEFEGYVDRLISRYKCKDLQGLPLAFCFKDVYTTVSGQKKNQVHTRSLHAEESAFLQLAKYGSQGIKEGKLFTTASPCELCAKKAYQLGIKEIYYIDTYPGISMSHILNAGDNIPEVKLFNGAIGRAYVQLYNPFLPLKDEIEAITGVDVKQDKAMKIVRTNIDDVLILEPNTDCDDRSEERYREDFIYENVTKEQFVRDVEVGLKYGEIHSPNYYKTPYNQGKLIKVTIGSVLNIIVDIRKHSPTFGKYVSIKLSSDSKKQLFIPRGLAHGYVSLLENSILQIKSDNYHNNKKQVYIKWNDSELKIDWQFPEEEIKISEEEYEKSISFSEFKKQ